ncbi:hypothetical protein [Streptomyces sp. NPDC001388]|uniref:hypothetical protein n=1 Tax=unclassified Streptomyces TaxID=2593676 RepID=UPI0036994306
MGERLNDGGEPVRRRAHPAETTPAADAVDVELEALLAEALRTAGGPGATAAGSEGELRALAAFRAARDAGEHRAARTRRRDDWRHRTRRRTARSLKATLSVAVASLALGGVAFAAIGSATRDADGAQHPKQSASASEGRSATPSLTPSPSASADRDRPVGAQDTEAQCRAYDQVSGRGKALDSTAWQRLVTAAGGEERVEAYCAAQTASASAAGSGKGYGNSGGRSGGTGATENAGSAGAAGNTGGGQQKAGKTATPENSAKGNAKNP